MISGRQAIAQIEDAVARVRASEGQIDAALRSAIEEASRLRAERGEAFRALARIRLDTLATEGVIGQIDAAERRALQLLEGRKRALDAISRRREAAATAHRKAEAERHARADAAEAALAAFEARQEELRPQIAASAEWKAQKAKLDAAAAMAEEADRKADVAEADREAKRVPYENDPLFMYLWSRRFGTADYAGSGLTRFIDRWVAGLVDYQSARANFTMLNEIPARLRAHATRQEEAIAAERDRLATLETDIAAVAGAAVLKTALDVAKRDLAAAEETLAAAAKTLAEIDAEHDATLSGVDDPLHKEAVEILAEADSRLDIRTLMAEARKTSTPDDEAVVRRIEELEARIEAADAEVTTLRREVRDLAKRRAEIERARDDARRSGYDRPHGGFANDVVIGQVIGGILGGLAQGSVLSDALRNGYRGPSGGVGGGWPSPGGREWPGPGGGGGFDPPSSGGDGFRTGGSF